SVAAIAERRRVEKADSNRKTSVSSAAATSAERPPPRTPPCRLLVDPRLCFHVRLCRSRSYCALCLHLEHGVFDVGLSDDGVPFEHRPRSPPTDFHDDPLGHTCPTKIAGGGAAKVVEKQVGDIRRHTCVPPLLPKIFDSFTIRSGEHVVVSPLAADAAPQQLIDRLGHRDLAAFAVLGGTRLQPDCAVEQVHLPDLHLAEFADSPP